MLPADEEIQELTRMVFVTIGMEVETTSPVAPPELLTFAVDVTGAWTGTIYIEIGSALAHRLAGAMLQRTSVGEGDVADAMKELANIIGGNVKGLMPGPSRLSLPRTGSGSVGLDDVERGSRQTFACDGEAFNVTVTTRITDRNSGES